MTHTSLLWWRLITPLLLLVIAAGLLITNLLLLSHLRGASVTSGFQVMYDVPPAHLGLLICAAAALLPAGLYLLRPQVWPLRAALTGAGVSLTCAALVLGMQPNWAQTQALRDLTPVHVTFTGGNTTLYAAQMTPAQVGCVMTALARTPQSGVEVRADTTAQALRVTLASDALTHSALSCQPVPMTGLRYQIPGTLPQ